MIRRWVEEAIEGERGYETIVSMRRVRPNPFVTELDERQVEALEARIRAGASGPAMLWLAELPDGTLVDVDTALTCEALRRAGLEMVRAQVIGMLTALDCERIGLQP